MIEHASLIAICIAGLALFGLIYIALFIRRDPDEAQPRQDDADRRALYKRWEYWL